MKPKYLIIFLLLFTLQTRAQTATIQDYKVKTAADAKERTEMLDALLAYLYKDFKMTFEFDVHYLKVGNNYAWFQGTADRKDGKDITFEEDDYDCCHVEALFQKKIGK